MVSQNMNKSSNVVRIDLDENEYQETYRFFRKSIFPREWMTVTEIQRKMLISVYRYFNLYQGNRDEEEDIDYEKMDREIDSIFDTVQREIDDNIIDADCHDDDCHLDGEKGRYRFTVEPRIESGKLVVSLYIEKE